MTRAVDDDDGLEQGEGGGDVHQPLCELGGRDHDGHVRGDEGMLQHPARVGVVEWDLHPAEPTAPEQRPVGVEEVREHGGDVGALSDADTGQRTGEQEALFEEGCKGDRLAVDVLDGGGVRGGFGPVGERVGSQVFLVEHGPSPSRRYRPAGDRTRCGRRHGSTSGTGGHPSIREGTATAQPPWPRGEKHRRHLKVG